MPWFWGRSKDEDDDEYSSSEYTTSSGEYETDDEEHEVLDEKQIPAGSPVSVDSVVEEEVLAGTLPEAVEVDSSHHTSPRDRAPSALSIDISIAGDDDDEEAEEHGQQETNGNDVHDAKTENGHEETKLVDDIPKEIPNSTSSAENEDGTNVKNSDESQESEAEQITSSEKQSLLILAAEHDRVDILQAILSGANEERDELLKAEKSIPPLHIAVSFGSTAAVTCLLRMGADPSLRPNIADIEEWDKNVTDVPNKKRFDGASAWELAFGNGEAVDSKSWSLFGRSSTVSESATTATSTKAIKPVDMPPSKREGIRHAFTAEALRCIGSDESDRLRQLLDSGMPCNIDIGGKTLYDWAVEMSALKCEELLRPIEAARYDDSSNPSTTGTHKSAVLDRTQPGDDSIPALLNRMDELENLSKALSLALDNVAEEVSVCSGLLLLGGGGSALASHVRSLKASKERKTEELLRVEEAWENAEDELAYWAREAGAEGKHIQLQATLVDESVEKRSSSRSLLAEGDEESNRTQLKAQLAASESKIRLLRASITDLSEEHARNLKEVERRGLAGGLNLVRNLREEIRDIDFSLSEAKSGEATCRTKINLIQALLQSGKAPDLKTSDQAEISDNTESLERSDVNIGRRSMGEGAKSSDSATSTNGMAALRIPSLIETGQSKAIALRPHGNRGYFTLSLWRILLRIIGLGDTRSPPSSGNNNPQEVLLL